MTSASDSVALAFCLSCLAKLSANMFVAVKQHRMVSSLLS
jgi:hypothetical protein